MQKDGKYSSNFKCRSISSANCVSRNCCVVRSVRQTISGCCRCWGCERRRRTVQEITCDGGSDCFMASYESLVAPAAEETACQQRVNVSQRDKWVDVTPLMNTRQTA